VEIETVWQHFRDLRACDSSPPVCWCSCSRKLANSVAMRVHPWFLVVVPARACHNQTAIRYRTSKHRTSCIHKDIEKLI
jgi:hypothetical protein